MGKGIGGWCIASVFLLVCSSASASDVFRPNTTLSADFLSRYVGGQSGAVAYGKPVHQGNVRFSWTSGLYANLWYSKSLGSEGPIDNFGNEIDYTLGWGDTFGGFGVDASFSYFDVSSPKLFEARGDMMQFVFELNRTFTYEAQTFAPYMKLEPTWVVGGLGSAGINVSAGVRHSWKLNDILTLTESVRVLYDSGIYDAASGFNARFDIGPVWKITPAIELRIPYLRYIVPLTHFGDGRKNEWVVGAGIDWHFN